MRKSAEAVQRADGGGWPKFTSPPPAHCDWANGRVGKRRRQVLCTVRSASAGHRDTLGQGRREPFSMPGSQESVLRPAYDNSSACLPLTPVSAVEQTTLTLPILPAFLELPFPSRCRPQ